MNFDNTVSKFILIFILFLASDAARIEILNAENRRLRNRLSDANTNTHYQVSDATSNTSNSPYKVPPYLEKLDAELQNQHEEQQRQIREILTPSSLDNEIESQNHIIKEDAEFERKKRDIESSYYPVTNAFKDDDHVSSSKNAEDANIVKENGEISDEENNDSQDEELYEGSSDCSLPDHLEDELKEENEAFADMYSVDSDVKNVMKMLGGVSDLGSTLTFNQTDPIQTVAHENNMNSAPPEREVEYEGIDRRAREQEQAQKERMEQLEAYKMLNNVSSSDDEELEMYHNSATQRQNQQQNFEAKPKSELDLDLTGIDDSSSSDEDYSQSARSNEHEQKDNKMDISELQPLVASGGSSRMSRTLRLADTGHAVDR